MRIGIDAQLLAQRESGVEGCVRSLVEALAQVDDENEYVIYTHGDAPGLDLHGNPRLAVRVTALPCRIRWVRILWQQMVLPRLLLRDRIDVLHAPAYVSPLGAPRPVVVTMHDVIAAKFPEMCKRANAIHYGLMLPRVARKAARIIASSECTRRDIVARLHVPRQKVDVIHPGVSSEFRPIEASEKRAQVARRMQLPRGFILFVGNLEPKKNLPTLIRAFARVKRKRGVEQRLVIGGRRGWKCRDVFEAVQEEGLGGQVHFCGRVSDEDLAALYSMADLFVFPSLYEGFGLPPLEAMACGTPVVAGDAGSLPEVLGDAALLVRPESVSELAEAMHRALAEPSLRHDLRRKGMKRARMFDWARAARETVAVYAGAVSRGTAGHGDVGIP